MDLCVSVDVSGYEGYEELGIITHFLRMWMHMFSSIGCGWWICGLGGWEDVASNFVCVA